MILCHISIQFVKAIFRIPSGPQAGDRYFTKRINIISYLFVAANHIHTYTDVVSFIRGINKYCLCPFYGMYIVYMYHIHNRYKSRNHPTIPPKQRQQNTISTHTSHRYLYIPYDTSLYNVVKPVAAVQWIGRYGCVFVARRWSSVVVVWFDCLCICLCCFGSYNLDYQLKYPAQTFEWYLTYVLCKYIGVCTCNVSVTRHSTDFHACTLMTLPWLLIYFKFILLYCLLT